MKYRLSQPEISNEEIEAVANVLKSEFFGMGKEVQAFENELSEYFGLQTLCVSTGTAAVQLALTGAGIGPGDEVLVPSLTYVATYQAISASGATPVSCDVDSETLQISVEDAENRINSNTKAIVPVYFSGATNCLDQVSEFGIENKLRVVADAAHAFGSFHNKKLVGSFGDINCFSFDGIKNITSGEGGCIVTHDLATIDRIRDARLLGVIGDSNNRYLNQRSWDFDVKAQGWRYHMSDIFASIGRVQLKNIDLKSVVRKKLFDQYVKNLEKNSRVKLFNWKTDEGMVPHILVVQVPGLKNRNKLREDLQAFGIPTGVHYKPNHLLSFYRSNYNLPVTEKVYPEIITLPLHTKLTTNDVDNICEIFSTIVDRT
jgi:dTDP-4-amino-4,6-dideoxygalactose transaminase